MGFTVIPGRAIAVYLETLSAEKVWGIGPTTTNYLAKQDTRIQHSLFEDPLRAKKIRELYEAVDALSGKYGKHTLHLGASHPLEVRGKGRRGTPTVREHTHLYGETRRRHLGLPLFQSEAQGFKNV